MTERLCTVQFQTNGKWDAIRTFPEHRDIHLSGKNKNKRNIDNS